MLARVVSMDELRRETVGTASMPLRSWRALFARVSLRGLFGHVSTRPFAPLSAGLITMLLALVCLRSWVFIRFAHAHMDADQAVFGIMAKDIALGRAHPLFMYGQRYMFAVGSWLCAPLFALFGVSVTALKLPMFIMNLACVCMLWVGLRRERGMDRWGTALAILPFAAASVVTASRLVEHQGGNIEPIFFLLLAFLLRERAVALGLVLGVAFLNREFTPIGLFAMLLMEAAHGTFKCTYKRYGIAVFVAALVTLVIRSIAHHQPYYRGIAAHASLQNVGEGLSGYFGQQLLTLLGAAHRPLRDFNITSSLASGHGWLIYVAIVWLLLAVVGASKLRRDDVNGMSTYLVLVGLGQASAFILLCDAPRDVQLVRYVLLTLCSWIGFTAYAWRSVRIRPLIAAVVFVVCVANLSDHVRLIHEYATKPPHHDDELLADFLVAHGVRYLEADYWTAYDIAWLTNERVIASPRHGTNIRVDRYREELATHEGEVLRLSSEPCRGGQPALHWYLCPLRHHHHHRNAH